MIDRIYEAVERFTDRTLYDVIAYVLFGWAIIAGAVLIFGPPIALYLMACWALS